MSTIFPERTGLRASALRGLRGVVLGAARYAARTPIAAPMTKQQLALSVFPTSPAVEQRAQDPADVFTADELPALSDIAAAAEQYMRAAEQARTAERAKRAARKLLDRLPAGRYGAWNVERVDNAREVADLDTIRAIFATHGLGEVPMKPCAPSLKVAVVAELAPVAVLAAA